jgi:hypothetical protein
MSGHPEYDCIDCGVFHVAWSAHTVDAELARQEEFSRRLLLKTVRPAAVGFSATVRQAVFDQLAMEASEEVLADLLRTD